MPTERYRQIAEAADKHTLTHGIVLLTLTHGIVLLLLTLNPKP